MPRRPITQIIQEVKALLEKENKLSVRQISIKTHCQWRTALKVLETMKDLGLVKEEKGTETERDERIFSLK